MTRQSLSHSCQVVKKQPLFVFLYSLDIQHDGGYHGGGIKIPPRDRKQPLQKTFVGPFEKFFLKVDFRYDPVEYTPLVSAQFVEGSGWGVESG